MNKRNKTYLNVEHKILRAIRRVHQKEGLFLRPRVISKEAHIAESTFHNHYCSKNFFRDHKKYLFNDLNQITLKSHSLETTFQKLLIEFYKNREIVSTLLAIEDVEEIRKFLSILKPIILNEWSNYDKTRKNKIFHLCQILILEEILSWKHEKFNKNRIELHVKHLIWITKNSPHIYNRMTLGE